MPPLPSLVGVDKDEEFTKDEENMDEDVDDEDEDDDDVDAGDDEGGGAEDIDVAVDVDVDEGRGRKAIVADGRGGIVGRASSVVIFVGRWSSPRKNYNFFSIFFPFSFYFLSFSFLFSADIP